MDWEKFFLKKYDLTQLEHGIAFVGKISTPFHSYSDVYTLLATGSYKDMKEFYIDNKDMSATLGFVLNYGDTFNVTIIQTSQFFVK